MGKVTKVKKKKGSLRSVGSRGGEREEERERWW
jgi:hypothetical protein